VRLLLIAVLLLGCSSERERKERALANARQEAAAAQQMQRDAEARAAEAQRKLEQALAEQKAAVADNEAAKRELDDAKQQTRELIDLANKKLAELKKRRDALPDGPERKAIDTQIDELGKVVRESSSP